MLINGYRSLAVLFFVNSRLSYFLRLVSSVGAAIQRKKDFLNLQDIRYQEYTPLGKWLLKGTKNLSVSHIKFKIMDYNILAQTHMMTHIRNYKFCPRECLNWSYRKSVLRDEFLADAPDIFCLQEVEGAHKIELLEPLRKMGFDALFVPRGEGKPDGCAILYKTSQFRVADFHPVHFLQPSVPLLDRPNVGMVAKLEVRQYPGNYIVIANTHLLYNQRRVDIKMCQLQILLAEIERIAYIGPNKYHPVVLTGDLNVNANSGLISLLRDNHVDYRQLLTKRCQPVRGRPTLTGEGEQLSIPADLLRQHLKISSSCQYLDVLEARRKGLTDPRRTKDLTEVLERHRVCPEINLDHGAEETKPLKNTRATAGSNNENLSEQEVKKDNDDERYRLRHTIPLVNVYNHPQLENKRQMQGPLENKDRKLNVYDYMFYSCNVRCQAKTAPFLLPSGQLQLLSRLRLPSVSEYYSRIQHLPNYACGSDHLPLSATFLLPVH